MAKKIVLEAQDNQPFINLNDNTTTYKNPGGQTIIVKNNPVFDGPALQKRLDELKQMHLDDIASQPGSTLDYCL